MAITALLSVANSESTSGLVSNFSLTVSNSSASPVTITSVEGYFSPVYGTRSKGKLLLGSPFAPKTISGNSSVTLIFTEVLFASSMAPYQEPPLVPVYWTVSEFVLVSDGSTATSNTVQIAVFPVSEPNAIIPPAGQLDLRSNLSAAILAAATVVNL